MEKKKPEGKKTLLYSAKKFTKLKKMPFSLKKRGLLPVISFNKSTKKKYIKIIKIKKTRRVTVVSHIKSMNLKEMYFVDDEKNKMLPENSLEADGSQEPLQPSNIPLQSKEEDQM